MELVFLTSLVIFKATFATDHTPSAYQPLYFCIMRKRFLRPSPFFVASILCLLYLLFELITSGGATDGWLFRIAKMLLPLVVFMVVADLLLKRFMTRFRGIVTIELLLFLGLAYFWVVS